MTAEAKVERTFGGAATASTAYTSIYQLGGDPDGRVDVAAARTAANQQGPMIITHLYGYASSYGSAHNCRMRFGTAETGLFSPPVTSSATDTSGRTGWKSCTTTYFVANGVNNVVFGYYDMGSFGITASRASTGGTVSYTSLGSRTGILGGAYRFAQSPAAPATPTLSLSNYRTIGATWAEPLDGGESITGYDLQYSTSSTFASGVTTVSLSNVLTWASSSLATPLAYGTRYYIRVAAKNAVTTAASTTSAYSTGANLWTAPETPTGLVANTLNGTATPATTTAIALDWGGNTTGVTRYRVSYKRSVDATWTDTGYSGTTSSYTVTGLSPATLYNFRVSAENSAATGSGVSSDYATVNGATIPSTPTGLTTTTITSSSIGLDWADSSESITNFVVQYKKSADSTWLSSSYTGTASFFTLSGLDFFTDYDIRVAAQNTTHGTISAYTSISAETLPVGPRIRSDIATWSTSSIHVCTTAGTWSATPNGVMYVYNGTDWIGVG